MTAFTLDDVLITPALAARPARNPDFAAEVSAMTELAGELARNPRRVLQCLTDIVIAMRLADAAGISLVRGHGDVRRFDWAAVSGRWADTADGAMPIDAGMCGDVIERDMPVLFEHPERVFPAAAQDPRIHEILLVPFRVDGKPIGALWAIAHGPERKFDAEDARLLTDFARFASVACQLTAAIDQAEQTRREKHSGASQERYRIIVESIDEGFCILEMLPGAADFRIVETNPAFENQTGLSDPVGRTIRAMIPAIEEYWIETYRRVATTGQPVRFEAKAAALDRCYDVYACRIGEPDQRQVAILFRDILPEKRARAELLESEERLRQFGENSPDTLWVVDARSKRLEYLSAAYERMWGEPRETVMGDIARLRARVHPSDRAIVADGVERLLAGARHSMEYRITRPDGEVRWIFDTGFPIKDDMGRVIRLAGVAQDLTARRQAEDRVRESERRFRTLSEGVPQLVWRAVDHGEWSWASPQWTNFTGISDQDSRGWGWVDAVHPDDRRCAIEAWERSRSTDEIAVDYRLRQAADGRYRWFTTRATPVYDDDGALTEWLGTSTDVDDLRRLQGHQQLLVGELQHRVRNSLAVIRSIARRTAATSKDVDEFAMHLEGRLASFARIQAAVTGNPAGGLDLRTIVVDELMAHLAHEGEQAYVTGPPITLQSKPGETLALAFHELATNAVKYGGLSAADGVIRVSWHVDDDDDKGKCLIICWDEENPGISVSAPARRGFGTELLEDTLGYELEADTRLSFRTTGLLCTITIPFREDIGRLA